MRSAADQNTLPENAARSLRSPRPGSVKLRPFLAALALSGLLSACSGAPIPLSASNSTDYQLRYGLGGNSTLQVGSPDLSRRLAEHQRQPSLLDLTTIRARAEANESLPDNLNIELSTPEQNQKSKLMLHFGDDGRFLDRASLDTNIQINNWLLGFNANLATPAEDSTGRSFHLQSEFSGLLGERQAPPAPRPTLPTTSHDEAPGGQYAAVRGRNQHRFGLESPAGSSSSAPQRYYLAFHDASLGADENGTLNLLFSFGGYLGEDSGEVVTTYRLLSLSGTSNYPGAERGSFEQAVALGYTGHFSSWIKSFGHTLTYFDYRGPDAEALELFDGRQVTLLQETNIQKWQSRVELSCGEDLPWSGQGILKGYRLDTHFETQAALERTGLLPGTSPARAAWGSQLRLKTDFGTLSGKVSRSASQHRLAFSLQKTALTGARIRLYYEDIDYRSPGELETRIGGQLKIPLDETLLKVLTPGYWKRAEANLFAAQPTRGYTAPRQGQHVPTLNNVTLGILQ